MKKIILLLCVFAVVPAIASEKSGRYQIVVEQTSGGLGPWILDTETGQVWSRFITKDENGWKWTCYDLPKEYPAKSQEK